MKYDTQGVITNFTPCCKDGFGRTEGFDHLTLLLLLAIDWDRNLFRFVFFLKILNWFERLSTCNIKLNCPVFFWVSFINFFVNILVESVPILLSIFAKQILPNNVMIDFWSWLWFSWLVGKHSWCNGQLVEKISSYFSNFLVFWIYMYLVFLSLSSWLVSKHIWCDERPVVVACKQTVNRLRYCTVLYGFVL